MKSSPLDCRVNAFLTWLSITFCLTAFYFIVFASHSRGDPIPKQAEVTSDDFILWTYREGNRAPFRAKFIRLFDDKVTLQRETGESSTTPLALLSDASAAQAKKLGAEAKLKEKKEGDFTYTITDNGVTIIESTFQGNVLKFPARIADLPVRSIHIMADRFGSLATVSNFEIPSTVTTIKTPFALSKTFSSITVNAENPAYCSVNGVLFDKKGSELVQYPHGKKGTSYSIPHGVTHVGSSAFYPSSLTEIIIPPSVTHIEWAAFSGTGLTKITIPASVTSIAANAFSGCESLAAITFEGDCPTIQTPNFYLTPKEFSIRYLKGGKGFDKPEFLPGYPYKPVEIDPATELFEWTAADGRKLKAKFVKIEKEAVMVEKEDGKQVAIQISKLDSASASKAKRIQSLINSSGGSK